MKMKNPRVEILIDELVLHGFSPAERDAIGEALTQELQQLVTAADPAVLAALGNRAFMRTANISLGTGARAQMVGAQVAQVVHGSLSTDGKRNGR